jgi:hypothetical protein
LKKPTSQAAIEAILSDFYKLCDRSRKAVECLNNGKATEADSYRYNIEISTPLSKYIATFEEWGIEFDRKRAFGTAAEGKTK